MTDGVNNGVSKELEIAADILRQFRARGLSYGEAHSTLHGAQTMLQKQSGLK